MRFTSRYTRALLGAVVLGATMSLLATSAVAQSITVGKTQALVGGTWDLDIEIRVFTSCVNGDDFKAPDKNTVFVINVFEDDIIFDDPMGSDGPFNNNTPAGTNPLVGFSGWSSVACPGSTDIKYRQTITVKWTGLPNSGNDIRVRVVATVPDAISCTAAPNKGGGTAIGLGNSPASISGSLSTADYLATFEAGGQTANAPVLGVGTKVVGISRGHDQIADLLDGVPGPRLLFTVADGAPADTETLPSTAFALADDSKLVGSQVLGWAGGDFPVTGLNVNHAPPAGGPPTDEMYYALEGSPIVYYTPTGSQGDAVVFAVATGLTELSALAVEDVGTRGVFDAGDCLVYADPASPAILVEEFGSAPQFLDYAGNLFDGLSDLAYLGIADDADESNPLAFSAPVTSYTSLCVSPAAGPAGGIPTNQCSLCIDGAPPTCEYEIDGDEATITVQDDDSGLQSISVFNVTNATVTIPTFSPGTNDPVEVAVEKIDPDEPAAVTLLVVDVAGNQEECVIDETECFIVIGDGMGDADFFAINHVFETQVGPVVEDFQAVLLDDIAEFVLPDPLAAVGSSAAIGAPKAKRKSFPSDVPTWMHDGSFAVQIVMWNPGLFPDQPEQHTAGLQVLLRPNGAVLTQPFGTDVGDMAVWHEIGVDEQGRKVIRFPFSIPGF